MQKHFLCSTTTMILILFVTLIQVTECERLKCNPVQFAERNKPFEIACNATDSVTDVYWYHGEDTSDSPILVYENGNQRGKEYQKGEYELTSNFYLKIVDTQVKHEGSYTLRIYFQDHRYEEITTAVRVYNPPSPPCPYVDVCGISCNGCAINVNTSGYLVCSVNGSRPDFYIDWSVDKPAGISYAIQEQLKRHNENRDTWHTERTISYHIDRCGTKATFLCMIEAPVSWTVRILETYATSIQISSDKCEAPISTYTSNNGKSTSIIIGVAVGIPVCVLLLGLFFFILKQRRGPNSIEEKKKILIDNLLRVYGKFCYVKLLPWEEPIPITALYRAPNCIVRDANEDISQVMSSDLLEKDFISQNSRILLVADFGHGKTSFMKYFVKKWITSQTNKKDQTTINQFILIHVQLKDVQGDELLSEIIKHTFLEGSELTSEDVDEILHTYDCIVLFSGLDEMSTGQECYSNATDETAMLTTMAGSDDRSKLTIVSILRNTISSSRYPKLKVWVTSTYIDYRNPAFALPYSKVSLRPFTKEDTKTYINNMCRYYLKLCGRGSELERIETKVAEHIEIHEIDDNFCETPLLLMMITHIITSRLVSKKYREVNFNKLTVVMGLVMFCLQARYVDKLHKHPNATETIKTIETKLGQLAFENRCKPSSNYWTHNLGEDFTKTALEIGFLKYSDKVELEGVLETDFSESPVSEIVFYHEFIKDYLAAQYILESNQEWERLSTYIDKSKDEGTIRLLQFMSGLDYPEVHRLFKVLLARQGMWNNLIDCLHEIKDPEQKNLIIKEFKMMHASWTQVPIIHINYLEKKYHKLALADFCNICGEHDIKLRLEFQEDCAITFLKEVTLPPLLDLVFTDMSFNEEHYISVITSLNSRNSSEKLWFVRCRTPKELSQTNEEIVNKVKKTTGMTIHHSEELSTKQPVFSTI